jgi:hypothetical protein
VRVWILSFALLVVTPAAAAENFGAALRLTDETPLSRVAAEPEKFADRAVLLRGRVADVCQRKGCWTILQDGDERIRVRFLDYAFFLPTDCNGREALVEGKIEVETLSEGLARHYEEESRDGNPDAVTGPRQEITMTATGVRLLP